MGTNYYRKRIITEEDKKVLHELIDEDKFISYDTDDPKASVNNYFHYLMEEIHICKISCRWQVCFDHNWGKYYQPNKASLDAFLREENTIIEDEYGRQYTPDKFWEVVNKHNSDPRHYLTAENSPEKPSLRYWTEDIAKCRKMFGVNPIATDFGVDGLRFAIYSDFS